MIEKKELDRLFKELVKDGSANGCKSHAVSNTRMLKIRYKKREGEESSLSSLVFYFLRPVLRAAMFPTFLPGGACLLTVVGRPGDWCEPPPCG